MSAHALELAAGDVERRALVALRSSRWAKSSEEHARIVVILSPARAAVERKVWAADALRSHRRELAHALVSTGVPFGHVLVIVQDDRGERVELLAVEGRP
jgi:hypothetical protein